MLGSRLREIPGEPEEEVQQGTRNHVSTVTTGAPSSRDRLWSIFGSRSRWCRLQEDFCRIPNPSLLHPSGPRHHQCGLTEALQSQPEGEKGQSSAVRRPGMRLWGVISQEGSESSAKPDLDLLCSSKGAASGRTHRSSGINGIWNSQGP